MAFRPHRGVPKATLLEEREVLRKQLSSVIISASSGSVSSQSIANKGEIIAQMRLIDEELYRLDPTNYPLNERVTRTAMDVQNAGF